MAENVRVVIRCRPPTPSEKAETPVLTLSSGDANVVLRRPDVIPEEMKEFTFDAVFGPETSQAEVFEIAAREVVDQLMAGYNGTVFAYGQTGSGKTFTMVGDSGDPGIVPRVISHLFAGGRTAVTSCSFLEIYNEEIRDLLAPRVKGDRGLDLVERPDGSVGVRNLVSVPISSEAELHAALTSGLRQRAKGVTQMNAESSRSHSVFTILAGRAKLSLVDLAGSERQSKSGAMGETLKEAAKINLSLSALGNVISALTKGRGDGGRGDGRPESRRRASIASLVTPHIPYRDSKLTRLLQDSLGGNTKTVMIATIGPSVSNYEETLSTLRYASRAKLICNKPNRHEDLKESTVRGLQAELANLRQQLGREGAQLFRPTDMEDLRTKLEKSLTKYQRQKAEFADREADWAYERSSLLETCRELGRLNKFYESVIRTMIPADVVARLESSCFFNEALDDWEFREPVLAIEPDSIEILDDDEAGSIVFDQRNSEEDGVYVPRPQRPHTADKHGRRPSAELPPTRPTSMYPKARGLVSLQIN